MTTKSTTKSATKPATTPTTKRPKRTANLKTTPAAAVYDSDLAYLDHELLWVEARCRRLAAQRRPKDDQATGWRGRHGKVAQPSSRTQTSRLIREETRLRDDIDARLIAHKRAEAVGEAEPLALDVLCDNFGLRPFERNILILAAGPCFSNSFNDRYGEVLGSDYCGELSVELAFAFHELDFSERITHRRVFEPTSPLSRHDLVTVDFCRRFSSPKDLLTTEVTMTTRTFATIVGDARLSFEFMEFSSLDQPMAQLDHVVLDAADKRRILSVVDRHDTWLACREAWGIDERITYGRGALMLFFGVPGTGKTMTAHAIAHHLGKRILNVDVPTFIGHAEAQHFLPALFREARSHNALLFFDECEVLFGDRRNGNALMTMLLTEIERFEGVAILATNMPEALDEALDRRLLLKVRFPEPDRAARQAIWRHHLPAKTPLAADVDLATLAGRYELTGGTIKNAVLMAVAAAVHSCDDVAHAQISMAHLEGAARDQLIRPRDEGDDVVHTAVELKDVVLDERLAAQVDDVIAAARNQRTVLDRWGIGERLCRGKGIVALLSGVPGTGKTLTAEAIACELGRPLLAVGSSSILSKWVGETERRVERLFQISRQRGAVLFIDECDAVLGQRDGPHGAAWSVSMVATLLRFIERHDGVVLLATNRPDALDAALMRRLSHHLRFALPQTAERLKIWQGLLPATVPTEGHLDLALLARLFPLSGAAIQRAVFRGAFRAARADRGLLMADLADAAAEMEPAQSGEQPDAFELAS